MIWNEVALHDICRPRQWKTISTKDLTEQGYLVYGANGIIGHYSKFTHEVPTLMITCRGATSGNMHISEPFSYINGNAMALDNLKTELCSLKFLFYFLKHRGFDDVISGSAQPQITQEGLSRVTVPIPTLVEQKNIVDKLDALLARVDTCRRRLDRVPLLIKRFRQAVLAAATAGDLTADWRENEGIAKSWAQRLFFDFCVLQRGYDLPLSKKSEGPYPIVTSAGIVAHHSQYKALAPGVVTGRSGSIGRVHFVETNYWPHNTSLFVKDFKGNLPKYVYYFLLGFDTEQFSASTAVPTLNRNNLRSVSVQVPTLDEQHEIVRRVEALFAFADRLMERTTAAHKQVDQLTPAILAKAFRGELVPQDPNDEPAAALLERIRAERAARET